MSTLQTYVNGLATIADYAQPYPGPTPEPDKNTPLRPLIDRVRDLLATIPDPVKADGLVLRELQARLRGRQGRSCSHVELGDCLRALGYQRIRRWSDSAGGFCSRWYLMNP